MQGITWMTVIQGKYGGALGIGEGSTSDCNLAVDRTYVMRTLGLFGVDKEPLGNP